MTEILALEILIFSASWADDKINSNGGLKGTVSGFRVIFCAEFLQSGS